MSGTKKSATMARCPSPPNASRHSTRDSRSDSGYASNYNRGTLAGIEPALVPPVGQPAAPSPPANVDPQATPILAQPAMTDDNETPRRRAPSPIKKHVRSSSKSSKPSRSSRTPYGDSRYPTYPCSDPNCPDRHYKPQPYPPTAFPATMPWPPPPPGPYAYTDPRYAPPPPAEPYYHGYAPPQPSPGYAYPPERVLRRTRRPDSYHEGMSRAITYSDSRSDPFYGRMPPDPGGPSVPPAYDPYSHRQSYFEADPERPRLRHAKTDTRSNRYSVADPHDLHRQFLDSTAVDHPSQYFWSQHERSRGHTPYGQEPPMLSGSRPVVTKYRVSKPEEYGRWPPVSPEYESHQGSYFPPREKSRRRDSSSARHEYERNSRRSSLASQEMHPSQYKEHSRRRKSSSRSSVSPGRSRAPHEPSSSRSRSYYVQPGPERRMRRDSSQAEPPVKDRMFEADRYMDSARGGPIEDDLATTMRRSYSMSGKRPGLIGHKQQSVTSGTSSRSRYSHGRHDGDNYSRSSRRDSEPLVKVQYTNGRDEVQTFLIPGPKDNGPIHLVVDEDGVSRTEETRYERAPSISSRWSWFTGSGKSGRSRASSDQRVDEGRGRRRMSIKSPIIEGSREDHWGYPR